MYNSESNRVVPGEGSRANTDLVVNQARGQLMNDVDLRVDPHKAHWLVFMEPPLYADVLNARTPGSAKHVRTLEEARKAMRETQYDALLALSPRQASGAATTAIKEFRAANPAGVSVYHGWDYRLEVSAPKAEACGADVLLLGGLLGEEALFLLTFGIMAKAEGVIPERRDRGWYERILKEACPKSPVWTAAEGLRKSAAPPNECE
jgi:hypothetical protein